MSYNLKIEMTSDSEEKISISEWLREWSKLIEKQSKTEDEWTTLDCFPNYKFKNLQIVPDEDSETELSFTIDYDSYKIINND